MPITRLDKYNRTRKAAHRANLATRRAKAVKRTTLTTPDYKKFCDICFEFYIRWRDNWIDGLDGKHYTPGDYEHYHACHYITRGCIATRYDPDNCHGQSSGHNWAMSQNAPTLIKDRTLRQYTRWMELNLGRETVERLEELSHTITHWTIPDWMDRARELYGQAVEINADGLKDRLNSIYKTIHDKRTLELIMEAIK